MSEKTENEFITMEDAADLMGVKARQVYYLVNSKGVFAKFRRRLDRRIFVRRDEVEKYMSEDFVEVS
jgi:hypothetical protein